MAFTEVDSKLISQQLHSILSHRGIPSAHARPETIAASIEIQVLNHSYNQLFQADLHIDIIFIILSFMCACASRGS